MNVARIRRRLAPVPRLRSQQESSANSGVETIQLEIPDYLLNTYDWAYADPRNVAFLDREIVVKSILWAQHKKLQRVAFEEIEAGQSVLQPASVYGGFSLNLAQHLGPEGRLEITDILPIQVLRCRQKLRAMPQVTVRLANARYPSGKLYDRVCCYFLLHEMPDDYQRAVTDALLDSIVPDGKVIFVDYHKPHWAHPLKAVMSCVFNTLEPYAKSLWRQEISGFATHSEKFKWRKETYFGGLFQKVVAERR
ncbi:MAG: rhodoquinone biosynthesis methyltransferase RquA [Gammaproteobacteria bacterium]|nr:rhodoquinone biosynthesis methyltransferase RquA [Gammaproteobacteria bacterium]MDH3768542.1 rhodoquinone biosynthesis methyltransferase RquA [Gammaproteobacteria bacterium]